MVFPVIPSNKHIGNEIKLVAKFIYPDTQIVKLLWLQTFWEDAILKMPDRFPLCANFVPDKKHLVKIFVNNNWFGRVKRRQSTLFWKKRRKPRDFSLRQCSNSHIIFLAQISSCQIMARAEQRAPVDRKPSLPRVKYLNKLNLLYSRQSRKESLAW